MVGNFENVGAERLAYFLVFQQHFLLLLLGVSREQKGNGVVSHPEHRPSKEGLEQAIAEKPGLILMDMMMPGLDGWEATRKLRTNPETKNIPISAATALFRQSDLNACIEAGCSGYIIKPFAMTELRDKIRELLRSRPRPLPVVSPRHLS